MDFYGQALMNGLVRSEYLTACLAAVPWTTAAAECSLTISSALAKALLSWRLRKLIAVPQAVVDGGIRGVGIIWDGHGGQESPLALAGVQPVD